MNDLLKWLFTWPAADYFLLLQNRGISLYSHLHNMKSFAESSHRGKLQLLIITCSESKVKSKSRKLKEFKVRVGRRLSGCWIVL